METGLVVKTKVDKPSTFVIDSSTEGLFRVAARQNFLGFFLQYSILCTPSELCSSGAVQLDKVITPEEIDL